MSSDHEHRSGCPISLPVGRVGEVHPPAELKRLATEDPVCPLKFVNGETGWLVTGFDLGRKLLADRRFSANRIWGRQAFGELDRWLAEGVAEEGMPPHLNEADPPEHTARRRAIMGRLTLHKAQSYESHFQALIDAQLDALEQAGPGADFMEHFARPVPAYVLAFLLGVPGEDREIFVELTDRIRDPHVGPEQMAADIASFYEYVEGIIAQKRENPGDDLLSDLVQDESLTHEMVLKDAVGILQAGHETTTTQFGYTLYTLLNDRPRWESLVADPTTVDAVVEESLRFLTIIDGNPTERTALEDVELGDVVISSGDTVFVSALAGNRDPSRYERPDEFDPSRDARGHLAFGGGIHMCAGQHVARLELRLGLTTLARRFPTMQLAAAPDSVEWLADSHVMSGPVTLPVTW